MKNKTEKNSNELFDKVRQLPTEIPMEQVEKMILNFPTHPVPPTDSSNLFSFLKLKYIAMIFIPIITVLAFWSIPADTSTTEQIADSSTEESVATTPASIEQSEETVLYDPETTTFIKETEPIVTEEAIEIKTKKKDRSHSRFNKVNPRTDLIQKEKAEITVSTNTTDTEPVSSTKKFYPPTYIERPKITTDPDPVPDFNDIKLRKLRRVLYKNLLGDGLIPFKHIKVEMKLFSDRILLNETEIPDQYLLKYQQLTNEVGTGPYRSIRMSKLYVLAGDFEPDGFKGSGLGQFTVDMGLDSTLFNLDLGIDRLIALRDQEGDALSFFAEDIVSKFPKLTGKRRLFGVNLKGDKPKKLHQELKAALSADNIINSENIFAVIEFSSETIRINGEILSGIRYEKYNQIINKYEIKRGRNRMIQLSPHIIRIGNYEEGDFTGTIFTLPIEE